MNSQILKQSVDQKYLKMCHEAYTNGYMSTRIMSQMSVYCISQIFYKRNLLSVKYFDEKIIDSTTFYILKKNLGDNKIAQTFQEWFRILKNAINKNYISKLRITIFKDTQMTEPIEMYSLKYKFFGYNKTGVEPEADKLYNDSLTTVRSLITTLDTLNELPTDKAISFLLTYNDLTPDYFVKYNADEDDINIAVDDAYFMNHNVIETPFHRLKVDSEYNKNYHSKIEERIILMISDIENGPINCYCPFNDKFCEIIYCKMCYQFNHAMCYGIFSIKENEVIDHVCINCGLANRNTVKCTDMSLIDLKEYDIQYVSYLRRALVFCLTKTSFTNNEIKFANTTVDDANMLLQILLKHGAITQNNNDFIPNHNKINEICKLIFDFKDNNYNLSFFLSQYNKNINKKRKFVPDHEQQVNNVENNIERIENICLKKSKRQKLTTIITKSQMK